VESKLTIEKIKVYLSKPEHERSFARYQESLLNPTLAFSPAEAERLVEIVRLPTPQYIKHQLNRFLIDLSWASSRLEGNTYTQLETQALIEYGAKNGEKSAEEVAMIMNHKYAIDHMLASVGCGITENSVIAIQNLLADDSMAPNSRHFLPQHKRGTIRSYTEDGLYIQGSSYFPPQAEDRGMEYIPSEFTRLLDSTHLLPDPINKSFFLLTRLPYLQPFYDANKRTSRIVCNVPLMNEGLSPISFVGFEKPAYLEGLIAFYELGDEQLMKLAYTQAYIKSAIRYMPFGEEERIALSENSETHLQDAYDYVMTGQREKNPVWLLDQINERSQHRWHDH